MRVVGEVADLIDRQEARPEIAPEAVVEGAGRFLSGEIEDQIGRGEEAGRVAGQDCFVDQVFGRAGNVSTSPA